MPYIKANTLSPFDFIHATRCIKCRMQRRCQYTPTQYITLYRLPWLLTRARIHSLHWIVVWVKSWFSFYHELNRLSLYISTFIIICLYMYVSLCAILHKNIYCKRSIHYIFQDNHISLLMRNKNEMS